MLDTLRENNETLESAHDSVEHFTSSRAAVSVSANREHAPIRSLGEGVLDVEIIIPGHLASINLASDSEVETTRHTA